MDTGTSFLPRSFFPGNNSLGSDSLRKALPALYLLGLAVVAGILAWQKIIYAKRLKGGLLMEHNETVNGLLRDMGMGHVLVFSNDEIASPLACGLIGPRICLPTRMDFGNTVLLRHVLAHEAMHIRRRDNWVKAVMLAALVLNWYNPLVWLMAKCLASDLEAACDAAVLKKYDTDERKSYAYSLLAMAVSASRSSLLYSAFSKTEVERRVKGILAFRKASAFALLLSVLLLAGGTVAFATGGQAPFSHALTSYCASSGSRWGVKVEITRDIALGQRPQKRAEDAVFSVLDADASQDPDIIREAVQAALAREFGVERSAFDGEPVPGCGDSGRPICRMGNRTPGQWLPALPGAAGAHLPGRDAELLSVEGRRRCRHRCPEEPPGRDYRRRRLACGRGGIRQAHQRAGAA